MAVAVVGSILVGVVVGSILVGVVVGSSLVEVAVVVGNNLVEMVIVVMTVDMMVEEELEKVFGIETFQSYCSIQQMTLLQLDFLWFNN